MRFNPEDFEKEIYENDIKFFDNPNIIYPEVDNIKIPSYEEELELIKRIKKGDHEATQQFIIVNIKLVRKIAWGVYRKNNTVRLEDLVQEGIVGLIEAIPGFDSSMGNKFSTYVTNYIRRSIWGCIPKYKGVLVGTAHSEEDSNKLYKGREELTKRLKRTPTVYELSEYLKMPIGKIEKLLMIDDRRALSLDSSVVDSGEPLYDAIPDPSVDVEESVLKKEYEKELHQKFQELMKASKLKKTEEKVLHLLYGFDGRGRRNLTEVGRELNISRNKAAEYEKSAMQKLRDHRDIVRDEKIDFTKEKKNIEYDFDADTKKFLKAIEKKLKPDDFDNLLVAVIRAKNDSILSNISGAELIVLLLSLGFAGNKEYPPMKIASMLHLENDYVRFLAKHALNTYKDIALNLKTDDNNIKF